MIDELSRDDLRVLAETRDGLCVSIYLPTHRSGPETAQDRIRLKNGIARATGELEALGVRAVEARRMLASGAALDHDAAFWSHVELGLAVFASHDGTRLYRLPDPVEDLVVVTDQFHLKPLLPVVATGAAFYVLVVGANQIRLLRGSRYGISELALGDVPASLAEALWFTDREAQLYSHAAGRVGTGDVTATFHGHGGVKDARGADLDHFFSAVDAGVAQVVAHSPAPVVLAGVRETVARYRRVSRYPHFVQGSIEGNAEELTPTELHARSWPLVERLFREAEDSARDAVVAHAQQCVDTLPAAVVAAIDGRVAALFVPLRHHCWGRVDAERRLVEVHAERRPGDRDLFDVAAVETMAYGGEVFVVEASGVPGRGPVAALLRF